jgi:hypothetical protein
MTHRILPARWGQEVVDLNYDGFSFRIAMSRFADGSPAEVRIDSARAGSKLDTYGRDVAALLSLLVQNGVDLSTIEHALDRNSDAGLASRVVWLIGGSREPASSPRA